MLIVRAPLRLSFAGGGTDLPAYYQQHGGAVVSTSIDKYFYAIASLTTDDNVQVSSADFRTFYRWTADGAGPESELELVHTLLDAFQITRGVSIFLASEVPPGTGLGSSSTVAVAMTKALSALTGGRPSAGQVAEYASITEIERMGMPIGRQDQYAAAFGGLNLIKFAASGVTVEPLRVDPEVHAALERRTLLFYTGTTRSAASILGEQSRRSGTDAGTVDALHGLKQFAFDTAAWLQAGDLDRFGHGLNEAWALKRRLSRGISNPEIDQWYELARAHGALGGKVAGAGGGGFLMLYCPEDRIHPVTTALEEAGLRRFNMHFESSGATVLVNHVPSAMAVGTLPAFFQAQTAVGI